MHSKNFIYWLIYIINCAEMSHLKNGHCTFRIDKSYESLISIHFCYCLQWLPLAVPGNQKDNLSFTILEAGLCLPLSLPLFIQYFFHVLYAQVVLIFEVLIVIVVVSFNLNSVSVRKLVQHHSGVRFLSGFGQTDYLVEFDLLY